MDLLGACRGVIPGVTLVFIIGRCCTGESTIRWSFLQLLNDKISTRVLIRSGGIADVVGNT